MLFKDVVGGGDLQGALLGDGRASCRSHPETRVLPGHTDETTIGREWEHNPFVRVRGVASSRGGAERCRVDGREATLLVWSPDYDGKGKAGVRLDDGRELIVGGSRIERL